MKRSPARHRFDNSLRYRNSGDPAQIHFTPSYVLDRVRESFGGSINLDPCTTPENPVGAKIFYSPPLDGLTLDWKGSVFVNPPYGKAREPWAKRCIAHGQSGAPTCLLIPAATDTRLARLLAASADAVVYVTGRLKFGQFGLIRPNGIQVAASHPSALYIWNSDPAPISHLGYAMTWMRKKGDET